MRSWHPDGCIGGQCVFEIGSNTAEFVSLLRTCQLHEDLRLALKDSELHDAIWKSSQAREYARFAAKMALGLDEEHPGVPYRTETDGSFTLGVDQKGEQMPEWPKDIEALIPVFNAMSDAVGKVPVVPGRATVNNLAFGKALMVAAFAATVAAASGDEWNAFGYTNDSSTEANTQAQATHNAAFTGLRWRNNSGGSGTNTLTFRDDGANGQQVAAGTGTGLFEDTTHTDNLTAGDLFNLAYTDTGTNSTPAWTAMNVEFTDFHGNIHAGANFPGAVFDVPSVTRFIALGGALTADGSSTESDMQWLTRAYDSWEALQVRVTANARVNQSDFRNRIDAADGSLICSYAAGATGLVVDTSPADSIADGAKLCASIALGTGVEDLTVSFVGGTFKSSTSKSEIWADRSAGLSRTASATANYVTIGGVADFTGGLAESVVRIKAGFAGQVKNLRCQITANSYTTTGTLKLMQNGTAVLTLQIVASATGWLENTTDFISFDADDEFSFEFDEGTSGSITIRQVGMTFAADSPSHPPPRIIQDAVHRAAFW